MTMTSLATVVAPRTDKKSLKMENLLYY